MELSLQILEIGEVASLLRVSIPTINRWLRQTRNGEMDFPLPISPKGCKGRWLASDIERYIESQSNVAPQVVVTSTKQQRREVKNFEQRQADSKRILEKHASGRKAK